MNTFTSGFHSSAWEVFVLFIMPFGGGIPAGVLLAQSRGIGWLPMSILYLLSDIALACVFEPLLWVLSSASKRIYFLAKIREILKRSCEQRVATYGAKLGIIRLVAISFGIDPMVGRAAALASGYRFISGWAIVILGDMLFFFLIMASTIWLNRLVGDGTWTAIIVMLAMFGIPPIWRHIRGGIKRRRQ